MRSAVAAAAFAGIATAAWAPQQGGWGSSDSWGETTTSAAPVVSSAPAQYTTDVVTAYTTYCPEATEITHGGQTYTATEVRIKIRGLRDLKLITHQGHHSDHHELPWRLHDHLPTDLFGGTSHFSCPNYLQHRASPSLFRTSIVCSSALPSSKLDHSLQHRCPR